MNRWISFACRKKGPLVTCLTLVALTSSLSMGGGREKSGGVETGGGGAGSEFELSEWCRGRTAILKRYRRNALTQDEFEGRIAAKDTLIKGIREALNEANDLQNPPDSLTFRLLARGLKIALELDQERIAWEAKLNGSRIQMRRMEQRRQSTEDLPTTLGGLSRTSSREVSKRAMRRISGGASVTWGLDFLTEFLFNYYEMLISQLDRNMDVAYYLPYRQKYAGRCVTEDGEWLEKCKGFSEPSFRDFRSFAARVEENYGRYAYEQLRFLVSSSTIRTEICNADGTDCNLEYRIRYAATPLYFKAMQLLTDEAVNDLAMSDFSTTYSCAIRQLGLLRDDVAPYAGVDSSKSRASESGSRVPLAAVVNMYTHELLDISDDLAGVCGLR